ncbi:hypothetical protein EG328_001339 [Venturia inaequalis]|uniref:Uncharacterized protein n=1 Tax=Venturia inaequalis TaxID=5025 RepID=A0A8H3V0C1_VENIN|nr:hypothetical protein EG328_001339 [Venturia inaequalis]
MSLIATSGILEADRHDFLKSVKIENHSDHRLALQPLSPHISTECLDDTVQHSNVSAVLSESQVKVTSWLQQYNNESGSGNRCIHAEDESTSNIKCTTPRMVPPAIVDPKSAAELEDHSEKRLSSADPTEQTRQTTDSSNEGHHSDSTATSVTPWGTPEGGSIRSAQGTPSNLPTSPSCISDFISNPNYYSTSIVSSILEPKLQPINPKKARLKNSVNRPDSPTTLSRARNQSGKPSSVAMGKRPVGYYGIGDYKGGFPPDVAQLASHPRPSSTSSQNSCMLARTDSKMQVSMVIARTTARSRLNASLPPHPETYELLTSADLQRDAISTQELSRFACKTPQSSGTISQTRSTSVVESLQRNPTVVCDRILECCAESIPVPGHGTRLKKGKRESLPIAFCTVTPPIFGRHGQTTRITTMSKTRMSKTIDLTDHYVPLSDACPLLVGSLATRQRLCVQGIDPEDLKVHVILKQHDIAIQRVSKSDQILLWHLAVYDESRSLVKANSDEPFSSAILWKGAGKTYSDVNLTLKIFLKWLKEKEQAHIKLYQRELKRLATRSAPNLARWLGQRDTYDDQAIASSGSLPLPHEPAAVWLNLYRLLRCRGISENQLDREQVMTLMSKPRHERREYLNTLAPQCKARTIDNADLDRRPKRHDRIACAQARPTMPTRSPSYSVEAQDRILDLPDVKKYPRRGRSGRRSYSVMCSERRTRPASGGTNWDTSLGQLPLHNIKDTLLKPLLSDIELPRNFVRPDRRPEREDELPPSRCIDEDGVLKDEVCALARRGSGISRFSRSTTASEREGKTRWRGFKKGARRCLPPCCCG